MTAGFFDGCKLAAQLFHLVLKVDVSLCGTVGSSLHIVACLGQEAEVEVILANDAADSYKEKITEYPTYDEAILDMEAGLEHLGRGTTEGMDRFIVVIEPGARSVQTYKNVKRLAEDLGVHQVSVVANKGAEEYVKIDLDAENYREKRKETLEGKKKPNILITTYGLVRNDFEMYEKMNFELIAIDEAQNIKNPTTGITKSVKIRQYK